MRTKGKISHDGWERRVGYDGLTDGINICCDGKLWFVLDGAEYGQEWLEKLPNHVKEEAIKDADFIVTAATTANAIDAMGLDGMKALGPALVELLAELKRVRSIDSQEQRLAERGIAVMEFWKAIKREE